MCLILTEDTRDPAEQRQNETERKVFATCLDVRNGWWSQDSKAEEDHVCKKVKA